MLLGFQEKLQDFGRYLNNPVKRPEHIRLCSGSAVHYLDCVPLCTWEAERRLFLRTVVSISALLPGRTDASGPVQTALQIVDRGRGNVRTCLKTLSGHAGLSSGHLAVLFREAAGMPFHKFLRSVRVAHAAEMLVTTEIPIAEIAGMFGFDQPSHFVREFRLGITPKRFRLERARRVLADAQTRVAPG